MKKTVKVNGKEYVVRYLYQKSDGTNWYVLATDGISVPGLSGDFGDEWPAS